MTDQRKRRVDGERTREAIVREAVSLATLDGLEGLSIGNLAAALDMSKSGFSMKTRGQFPIGAVHEFRLVLPDIELIARSTISAPDSLAVSTLVDAMPLVSWV